MHYITVNATRIQKESTAINNININIFLPFKFFPCLTPFQDIDCLPRLAAGRILM